ncbi:MAG: hypothetical protein ACJ8LN_12730, partial [Sulfurifustis sp.]
GRSLLRAPGHAGRGAPASRLRLSPNNSEKRSANLGCAGGYTRKNPTGEGATHTADAAVHTGGFHA